MAEISFLTESDRVCWEVLARGKDMYFEVERSDDDYERTWRRLLDDEQTRGIAARVGGEMVGIAHYVFHASVWGPEGAIWQTCSSMPKSGDEVSRRR